MGKSVNMKQTPQIRPDRSELYETEAFIGLKKILADNLKRIRQERQITQEACAHQCGLAVRQYQALEGETSNTTLLTLSRLLEGLEVSAAELLVPPAKKKRQT